MLRAQVQAPMLLLLLVGVCDSVEGASAGGCGGGNSTTANSGLFWMGDHLEYDAVATTMGFVIVFTIFCEYCVMRSRKWIKHFNVSGHPPSWLSVTCLTRLSSYPYPFPCDRCTVRSLF